MYQQSGDTINTEQEITGFQLSPQQRQLWRNQVESSAYRSQCAIALEGEFDETRLRAALENVVERHEVLRTVFQRPRWMNMPLQVIAPRLSPSWREVVLSADGEQQQQRSIERIIQQEARAPFDFENGPMLRAVLVHLGPRRAVAIITLPAITADHTTQANLVRELGRSYAALAGAELPDDEPVQYLQFSEWQNELLHEEDAAEGKAFWERQSQRQSSTAALPFEERSAEKRAFDPAVIGRRLESGVVTKLEETSAKYAASAENFLHACWQTLIWKFSGQAEMTVWQGFDGRKYEELKGALGPFTRMLPIHTRLDAGMRFDELVAQIEEAVREASLWQEYFAGEGEAGDADSSRMRFEFNRSPEQSHMGGVTFSVSRRFNCSDPFKIKLSATALDGEMLLECHYDSSLFNAESIERLINHLPVLINNAVASPEARLDQIGILSADDLDELLVTFNDTAAEYPRERCIHELIDEQAARTPNGAAVVYEGSELTYEQLVHRANQLANYLRKLGVGPEALVGVCMERSEDMIVAMLGVLKAGGAYLPLDPAYPVERLAFMLNDAQAPVLLTHSHLNNLADHCARVVCIDGERAAIERESAEPPVNNVTSDNLAYTIYTSGSTGKPKGVLVTHRNLVHSTTSRMICYSEPVGVFLLLSSFAFDSSVAGIFWTLCQGGALTLPREGIQRDLPQLIELVARHRVTHMLSLPSLHSFILEQAKQRQLESLKAVIVAGEACPPDLVERHYALLPHVLLFNEYGPTEGTVWSSVYLTAASPSRGQVPIGSPIPNMRIYILDSRMEPTPVGIAGEIYIGGAGLTRGYLNRAELTAEKFVPDPFAAERGERLYRTGDLACYLPDGNIEFIGRVDQQVKLRGYRIELGEVEAMIAQCPGVQEAVAVVREDEPGDKRLTAYVVPNRKHAPIIAGHARHRLPNNLAIVCHEKREAEFLFDEIFGNQNYLKHGVTINDGDCVIDVGAHLGLFSLFASHRNDALDVYAFEPIPATFELMQINASLYAPNVKAFNLGLSNQDGTQSFNFYPAFSMLSGRRSDSVSEMQVAKGYMIERQADAEERAALTRYFDELMAGKIQSESAICRVRTLSSVIAEQRIERIDLLKISVGKSDLDVLEGLKPDDWKKVKQIVLETRGDQARLDGLLALLGGHGYRLTVEAGISVGDEQVYKVYAASRQSEDARSAEACEDAGPTPLPSFADSILNAGELREFARATMPEYMVPSAFVILEMMPMLPNGKVDRKALPSPEKARSTGSQYVAPGNEVEQLLATIWAEALRVERVGINDNFFDLGGHSYLAIKVHNRLCHELQRNIPLFKMFEHPTVHAFAQFLASEQESVSLDHEQNQDWAEKRRQALGRQRGKRRA